MSKITLDALTAATLAELPDASPAVQGDFLAALIQHIDTTPVTPKPVRKPKAVKADPTVGTGAAMKANHAGIMMKSDAGTATKGQIKRLVGKGVTPKAAAKLSMVAASNRYAKLKG